MSEDFSARYFSYQEGGEMKLKLIPAVRLSVLLSLCCLGTRVAAQNPQNESLEQAKVLWEQAIAAKGGRAQLHAVCNLLVTSKIKYDKPPEGYHGENHVILFALPDKYWFWYDDRPGGFGKEISTYDFGANMGWEVGERTGLEKYEYLPPEVAAKASRDARLGSDGWAWRKRQFEEFQFIYLMETKWLQPKITGARIEKVGSKKYDVVETTSGIERIEFYLDQQTHLPARVVIRINFGRPKDFVDVFVLGDYVDVNGLKLPRRATRGSDKDETIYQVNVDYDEGLFARPPVITDGPDSWRKR
jgi:hypothetical protein